MAGLNWISRQVNNVKAFLLPTWGGLNAQVEGRGDLKEIARNLSRYISPVQLARIKQDIQTWRDAISEAENAWYPQRVKMQRMYLDTILNGHVYACLDRRKKLTMLKNYHIVNKKTRKENPKTTAIFKAKWFRQYMEYELEAKAFGYSLIFLGDLVNDAFPELSIVRRFNVSPDRLNVAQFVYSISGAPFLQEPYKDWHIWIDTPSDVGVSTCGYGYLYKVALYEIFARNVVSQNATAIEMYGMPTRIGKTNKTAESEERAIFEQALADMGSAGYILMDAIGDTIELTESKSLGQGYKIYESLEKRLEAKISKIILGHADGVDSTPGKLGNQDGDDNPVAKALKDTATVDMNDLVDCTNNQLIPNLRNLGFDIPEDEEFEFDNNAELEAVREKEDEANLQTSTIFQNISLAGGDPDWGYFTKRTGIPVAKKVMPAPPLTNNNLDKNEAKYRAEIKAKLTKLYSHAK